jgi:HAD superfamily hydrolase (TIGR01490 family)
VEASVDRISQPVAAFFDLDKTIISKSSTLAFGRPFYQYGLITRGAALRCVAGHLAYRTLGASHGQMERIRDWATGLCYGWPVDQVREIVARHLDEVIVPYIYAEARALIAAHRAAGRDVIIVSTSGHEVVDPIARLLGADAVIATRMRVESGCYSGQLEFYAYGEAKAARIRALTAERGYRLEDCHAYSDSATDLPLLQAVGHPHAVNPDRALRRVALQRGWPVLKFAGASNRPLRGRRQREPASITNRSR